MIVTPEWHHLHAGDIDAEVMLQSSEGPCKKSINRESVKFWQLVEAIESELQSIISKRPSVGSTSDLFEVFCGPESQLTSQAQSFWA